jgi:hypothetical protein
MSWRTRAIVIASLTIAAACTADRSPSPTPTSLPPSATGTSGASPSQSETPPPPPPVGHDIGLRTDVCNPARLRGIDFFGEGIKGSAWTGQLENPHGRCPSAYSRSIVAVDVTGDGRADAFWGPIPRCKYNGCGPLGTADFDADADQELVIYPYFSIVHHLFFSIRTTGDGRYAIDPILVAPPGHPEARVNPGKPLITSAAGDAGYDAWMRCEGFPEAPVLVWVWVSAKVESDDPAEWHEVKLRLEDDGMFHVIDATDITLPPTERPDFVLSDEPACGIPFNRWAARP